MAIEIISTLKPKNNGNFPVAEAKDVSVDENGTRLPEKLEAMEGETLNKILDPDNNPIGESGIVGDFYTFTLEQGKIDRSTGADRDGEEDKRLGWRMADYIPVKNWNSIVCQFEPLSDGTEKICMIAYTADFQSTGKYVYLGSGAIYTLSDDFPVDTAYLRGYFSPTVETTCGPLTVTMTNGAETGGKAEHKKIYIADHGYSVYGESIDTPDMHKIVIEAEGKDGNTYNITEIKAPTANPQEATLALMNAGNDTTQFVDFSSMTYDPENPTVEIVCQTRGGKPLPEFSVRYNNGDGNGRVKKLVVKPDAIPIELTSEGLKVRRNNNYDNEGTDDDFVTVNLYDFFKNAENGGTGGGAYVLELSGESMEGTVTDEQYNAIVANAPNVVCRFGDATVGMVLPLYMVTPNGFQFMSTVLQADDACMGATVFVNTDKTFIVLVQESVLASKDYVDNAVANAGGGSGGAGGGTGLETITFTDRPSAWAWLKENYDKVIQAQLISRDTFDPKYTTVAPVRDSYSGEVQKICFTSVFVSDLTADDEPNGQRLTYSNNVAQINDQMLYIYFEPVNTDFIEPDQIVIQNEIGSMDDSSWDAYQIKLVCYYVGASSGGGSVELDTTLTQEGKAADAKAVGDRFGDYVDDVDALLGDGTGSSGGSGGGGMSIKSITFTDRPTAYAWLLENATKVLKAYLASNQSNEPMTLPLLTIGSSNGEPSYVFMWLAVGETSNNGMGISNMNVIVTNEYTTVNMSPLQLTATRLHEVNVSGESPTTIPDEYWSVMSAQLTCYYIE